MSILNNLESKKYPKILFYLFVVIYSSLLVYLAYTVNIWEDEAYTLNTTSNKLSEVISLSYGFEGQPPFYFVLLSIWRLMSPGIFFARLFSILCIGLSAYVLSRIVPLISDLKSSNWIVIIFLLNPFTVWAALEIRTYALLIFLSTFSLYSILRYYIKNEREYLYYFLLICLVGLYTQYYFVFLIAAIALCVLIYKGWQPFFSLSLYLIPVIILFLPNFYFIPDNVKNFQSFNTDYSVTRRFSVVLTSIQNIALGLNLIANKSILIWTVRIIFFVLIIVSYIGLYKKRKSNDKINFLKYNSLVIVTILTLFFFISLIVSTGMYFNLRYLAITFPLIVLLFTIFNLQTEIVRNIIFSVLSMYFIFLLTIRYSVPIKSYDYESIAKYVTDIEKPNEHILINSRTISTPFQYYYSGINRLVELPDTFKLEKEGFQVLIRDTLDLKLMIEYIESKSFIFINDNLRGYSSKMLLNTEVLDKYLNTKLNVTMDTLLFGKSKTQSLRVRRLEPSLPYQW